MDCLLVQADNLGITITYLCKVHKKYTKQSIHKVSVEEKTGVI